MQVVELEAGLIERTHVPEECIGKNEAVRSVAAVVDEPEVSAGVAFEVDPKDGGILIALAGEGVNAGLVFAVQQFDSADRDAFADFNFLAGHRAGAIHHQGQG